MQVSLRPDAILDRAAMLERVGGDHSLMRELTEIFLEEYPRLLVGIRSAVEARDANCIERAAHSLKGAVANFGAAGALQAALAMELVGREGRMSAAPDALRYLEAEFQLLEPALHELLFNECTEGG